MATRRKKTDVEAALKAVSEADVKKILEQVGTVQTSVQSTLAALGVTLTGKVTELRDLETAIEARKQELKDIHEIEVNADTLDEIAERVTQAEEAAAENTERLRKKHAEEREERLRVWQRELEEHKYEVEQRDLRDAAQLKALSEARQREESIRAADAHRAISQELEELRAREEKVADLEAAVDSIPAKIEEAVEAAKKEVTDSLSRVFGHEKALLKKDAEAAAALAAAQAEALSKQISSLQIQLHAREKELESARNDAREIASKAVEASSQRQALSTLQDSMKTQAQAATQGRGR